MCTAANYKTHCHYFGRTLDLEHAYYAMSVTVTPRNFPLRFRKVRDLKLHYAMIGMATVAELYPLYYDATNEMGLSIAGLNFPQNAEYKQIEEGMDNIAPFEFIPWILGQCANVEEARILLKRMNVIKMEFHPSVPLTSMHWLISDREQSITVEPVCSGLNVYENPVGILANNPQFGTQLSNLNNYIGLSRETPCNRFSNALKLECDSCGMGALGLPGDFSSASRFARAAFVLLNSVSGESESESISQFFHVMDVVKQPRGCVQAENREYMVTLYTSCCNTDKGLYYYTTYENRQISCVDLHRENLSGNRLASYPLVWRQQIRLCN
ncbi:MAG: choloylglycine hydrolase family protein [Anaerotruncus sp.]|nr:choloylglycine hydrolase family protein [Anaerotruncus sp.]